MYTYYKEKCMKRFLKLIAVAFSLCVILSAAVSCRSQEQIEYYSQMDNYIGVTGIVTSVKYDENARALYVEFSDLSVKLDDNCFKIIEENLKIAEENGIYEKLKIGELVTFITAPRYFGDGYVMPIVALSVNGKNILQFEEGYANLLAWLSE